jgi:uncharacterized integral membrane protein
MADPHHVATLDGLDRLTVRLYRLGFFVSAAGLAALASTSWSALDPVNARWVTVLGITISSADLHLYDKRFRWFIPALAWAGLLCLTAPTSSAASADFLAHLGLGLQLVTLSALALKERLCFRVPGLRLVPLLLAVGIFSSWFDQPRIAAASWGGAALVVALLAVAKLRMPLHFDIGDRAHYQL